MKIRTVLWMTLVPFVVIAQSLLLVNQNVHTLTPNPSAIADNPSCCACHPVTFKNGETNTGGAVETNADAFTLACLNCHDGNTAKMAMVQVNVCPITSEPSGKLPDKISHPVMIGDLKSHPVLVEFPYWKRGFRSINAPLQGKWEKAQKVSDLLREGKIVCVSCHMPHFTDNKSLLRTSNSQSQLCFGCHSK